MINIVDSDDETVGGNVLDDDVTFMQLLPPKGGSKDLEQSWGYASIGYITIGMSHVHGSSQLSALKVFSISSQLSPYAFCMKYLAHAVLPTFAICTSHLWYKKYPSYLKLGELAEIADPMVHLNGKRQRCVLPGFLFVKMFVYVFAVLSDLMFP